MRNNQMTTPRYWIKMIPTESVSHSEPCYSPNTKTPANLAGFDRLPLRLRITYFTFVFWGKCPLKTKPSWMLCLIHLVSSKGPSFYDLKNTTLKWNFMGFLINFWLFPEQNRRKKIVEKFPIRTETWFSNAMIIFGIQSQLPYWLPVLRTMWQWKPFQLPLVFQIIKPPDRQNDKSLKLQGIQAPDRRFNSRSLCARFPLKQKAALSQRCYRQLKVESYF